jgi:FlaA1/EpsC-like NDP-sugar epimerase
MSSLFIFSNWLAQKTINYLYSRFLKLRNRHLFLFDFIVFTITPLLALILRLDGTLKISPYLSDLVTFTIIFLATKLTVFSTLGFYKRYWRYASIEELTYIAMLTIGATVLQTVIFDILDNILHLTSNQLPDSLPLIDGLLSCIVIGGLRFSFRLIERIKQRRAVFSPKERVLIVGAGSAGVAIVQEMQRNPQLGLHPVAFVDDNPEKHNHRIRGINVIGDRHKIPDIVKSLHVRKVIIAMPTVAGQVIKDIVDICTKSGVQTSTVPGINEIINGRVPVESIRDVRIEDLLRREPVQTEVEKVKEFIRGKKVLITGAGGSIGSELSRQILNCRPAEMMLVGHGENSVFNIQQELEQVVQGLRNEGKGQRNIPRLSALIADIRFKSRLQFVFEKYQPDVIFHAAAHKHVPLMELNPGEAISNNVIGTKNLVDLALEYNVKHFVMISTDKAVNPTNVMGASKRVAEMIVLQAAQKSGKSYVAVRFGNVLGSRGSVVPTFKKQIAAGGPITVTHPEICRYFMTIPEAVQLVLQGAVLGGSGEVLMLNMGEPVKIVDLAKELIRLSGYEVNKDIDIVFTGLRPGEKLYEELFVTGEKYEPTQHQKLFVVKNASGIVPENLLARVDALSHAASKNDRNSILFLLEQIVPGYKPKYLDANPTDIVMNVIPAEKSNSSTFKKVGTQS